MTNSSPDANATGLLELANQDIADIVAIRRDIHAHPELGNEEVRTSAMVADTLAGWGITDVTPLGGTGLVATIRGSRPGSRAVGLRCDMDALAIEEANGFEYSSTYPGKMHACGHDGHTSMLLGAARLLHNNPDFEGTAHLIFQPAEEGRGGAMKMLNDGLFERFNCDRIFGMHTMPGFPLGTFGTRTGPMLAASGRWSVEFQGEGGHGGATPHLTQDLSVVAAGYINSLQTVVSRNISAFESAIISVGHIHGGSPDSLNVLPNRLQVGGTMRAFSEEIRELLEKRITELAEMHAATQGATAKVDLWWNAVPTITDADATVSGINAANLLGNGVQVDPDVPPSTGGEDFSFMLRERPGSLMWLGNGVRQGPGGGQLHTPLYDFNDLSAPWGIAYWLSVVNVELNGRLGE